MALFPLVISVLPVTTEQGELITPDSQACLSVPLMLPVASPAQWLACALGLPSEFN